MCREHEFAVVYGLCACTCNVTTAVCQYVVGRLTEAQAGDDWPYSTSWPLIASLMFVGAVLTLVLDARRPKAVLVRERSRSLHMVCACASLPAVVD